MIFLGYSQFASYLRLVLPICSLLLCYSPKFSSLRMWHSLSTTLSPPAITLHSSPLTPSPLPQSVSRTQMPFQFCTHGVPVCLLSFALFLFRSDKRPPPVRTLSQASFSLPPNARKTLLGKPSYVMSTLYLATCPPPPVYPPLGDFSVHPLRRGRALSPPTTFPFLSAPFPFLL